MDLLCLQTKAKSVYFTNPNVPTLSSVTSNLKLRFTGLSHSFSRMGMLCVIYVNLLNCSRIPSVLSTQNLSTAQAEKSATEGKRPPLKTVNASLPQSGISPFHGLSYVNTMFYPKMLSSFGFGVLT